MPHITREVDVNPANDVVTPIAGNTEHGGACYDGNGKALYGVYDGTDMVCYRTTGNARTFVEVDDSVSALSTILSGPFDLNRNCCLTNIDGTIYANVVGGDGTNYGQWIYRDTGGGGTGPWVLHGTVSTSTYPGGAVTDSFHRDKQAAGGEIITVTSTAWAVSHVRRDSSDGAVYYGMSASADAGGTWTEQWSRRKTILGVNAYDMDTNTPTFGKDKNGRWWGNWNGNEALPLRSSSIDNTWGASATSGENGNHSRGYQFSVGDRVYAITNNAGATTTHEEPLEYTDGTPTAGPWTHVADLTDSGLTVSNDAHTGVYNIGSVDRPILAAVKRGEVLFLGAHRDVWKIGAVSWHH